MIKLFIIAAFSLISSSLHSQQWVIYNTQNSEIPFNTPQCVSIEIDRNGKNIKWIGVGLLTKFVDNKWTIYDSTSGMTEGAEAIAIQDSVKWCGTVGGGLVRFDNINWQIWTSSNSPLPNNTIHALNVDKFGNIILGAPIRLVKFNYSTNSWKVYSNLLFGNSSIEAIIYENSNNSIWAGTYTRGMFQFTENQNDTILKEYNASNSGIGSNTILEIDIDQNANKWIATQFGGGLRKFNSIDSTWAGFFPGAFFTCLLVDDSAGVKWLGTPGGGLWKFIGDSVWVNYRPENSPFPSYSAVDVAKDSLNNIWICSVGGLVVHNPSGVVGVEGSWAITVPVDFKLYQNYPNPFNPKTTIEFELTKPGNVKIKIYNSNGEVLKILTDKHYNRGTHKILFDAAGLASGVYYYQLETSSHNEARKMILIK